MTFFGALPSFLHPISESYNYPKMTILAIFCKKVRLKKLIFGFKTAQKCSTFQEKVSLIKGSHQKKFGTSKVKIKNFISKKRTPPQNPGILGGEVKMHFREVRLGMFFKSGQTESF